MKIVAGYVTMRIGELPEFHEGIADDLIHAIRAALTPFHTTIEIDLAGVQTVDCVVSDVLLAVQEEFVAAGHQLKWRIVNPSPDLRQLLELVRLHHLFEITPPRAASLALS